MDRASLGKLIKALREQHFSAYKKMTQAELAKRIHRDKKEIEALEQGKIVNISQDLLADIASALKLTTGERTELFSMASNVSEDRRTRGVPAPDKVRDEMIAIMSSLQVPSMLMDRFGDLIAVNTMLFAAYDVEPQLLLTPSPNCVAMANIMRLLFAPEFERQRMMFDGCWDEFAIQSMKIFRTMSLRQRSSAHFYALLDEMVNFPEFIESWLDVYFHHLDHYIDNSTNIKWIHPKFGRLDFVSSTITGINKFSDLILYSMIPASKDTYDKIGKMLSRMDNKIVPIIPEWPRKKYLLD